VTDDLASTLRAIIDRLAETEIPYMLVGSVAALAHGRSRATQDFDLVIDVDAARLRALVASLPAARFYVSEEAALDALQRQTMFNVIDLETGWKIDLVPRKRRPFSGVEFSRRQKLELLGLRVFVASVEDTIIAKLEWSKLGGGSSRQLEDVRELVSLAGDRLDHAYVRRWVADLGLEAEWEAILPDKIQR
jgi:hypothetical protein